VIRRMREFFCDAVVNAEPVEIAEIVEEVAVLMQDEAARAGASFEIDLPRRLTARVDKLQIEQVLVNLARNSFDALASADQARRIVRISAGMEDGMLMISLQDNGPGIDREISDRLFSPFTTTRSFGMGLGLSISRSIIRAHGGRLWIGDSGGSGALFHFTVPAA